MIKRHSDQIWARLDQLYSGGITFISWGELYHWYDIERISKHPYRDLKSRWEQLLDEKDKPFSDPKIAKMDGGIALFFATNPETLSEISK